MTLQDPDWGSPEDGRIQAAGYDPETVKKIQATRVLVEVLSKPGQSFEVHSLVKATGLSQWAVTEILSSGEFRDLIDQSCRDRVGLMMHKALRAVENVFDNQDAPRLHLEAARVVASVYRTLSDVGKVLGKQDKQAVAEEWLASLRNARQIEISDEIRETAT